MLSRCESHGWPDGKTQTYVAKVEPSGATNEAVICGRCEAPGDIYLNDKEYYRYEYYGKRLYSLKEQNIVQIKLSESPVEVKESLTRDEDDPPDDPSDPETESAADTDW